jgi:hypothetical protein
MVADGVGAAVVGAAAEEDEPLAVVDESSPPQADSMSAEAANTATVASGRMRMRIGTLSWMGSCF